MVLTFESLPSAVAELFGKLDSIEKLLLQNSIQAHQEPDRWVDIVELCEYLPDKPVKPTVYGWVHTRTIPFHKRGKKLFFLKSEIDAWLKSGRKQTNAEAAAEAEVYIKEKGRRYGR